MFSGKTEELIRRLKRAQFAKQRVENLQTYDRYSTLMLTVKSFHTIKILITSTPVQYSSGNFIIG